MFPCFYLHDTKLKPNGFSRFFLLPDLFLSFIFSAGIRRENIKNLTARHMGMYETMRLFQTARSTSCMRQRCTSVIGKRELH